MSADLTITAASIIRQLSEENAHLKRQVTALQAHATARRTKMIGYREAARRLRRAFQEEWGYDLPDDEVVDRIARHIQGEDVVHQDAEGGEKLGYDERWAQCGIPKETG